MAEPIPFNGGEDVIGAAPGDGDRVKGLPCHIAANGEVIACWKLSEDEIAQVLMTGEVWVSVCRGAEQLHPYYVSGLPLMAFLDGQPYLAGGPLTDQQRAFLEPSKGA